MKRVYIPTQATQPKGVDEVLKKYGDNNPYTLSMYNLDKKIPHDYDSLVIPEIEEVTRNIAGDTIKNKLYNNIVYYYNRGNRVGILETLNVFSGGKTKQFSYRIGDNSIKIETILV